MEKEQSTLNLKGPLLEAVTARCQRQGIDFKDFVLESVEKKYLFPFFSERHLRNYYYLQNRFSAKENSIRRQVLFYILAYDGIYMEYIDDIYKLADDKEIVSIPKNLNDILHPGFCLVDAACDFFNKGTITNMENKFKRLRYDDNEMVITLNAIMLMKGVISIKDELYAPELFKIELEDELNKRYAPSQYLNSKIFGFYSDKMKQLIEELFDEIHEKDIDVAVVPCSKDELTFLLITHNDKRLAIVSSSDDGTILRIGINRWNNGTHGNMLYCYEIGDVELVVKDEKIPDSDLLTKYKELI